MRSIFLRADECDSEDAVIVAGRSSWCALSCEQYSIVSDWHARVFRSVLGSITCDALRLVNISQRGLQRWTYIKAGMIYVVIF